MDSSKLESFTLNIQKQTPPPNAKGETQSPIVSVMLNAKVRADAGSPADHFVNSLFPEVVKLIASDPGLSDLQFDPRSRSTNVALESGVVSSNFRFVAAQPAKSAVAVALAPVPSLTLAAPTSPGAPPPKG